VGSHRTVPDDLTATTEGWTAARARPRLPHGILFVLRSGIPWQTLPRELGCGSDDVLAAVARLATRRHWDLLACAAETLQLANEVCPGSASEAGRNC
jgi:hypothetical protein